MSFRDNLRYFMDYKNIRPKELANKTEIDIKAIQSYIKKNNPSIPNAETAVRIAKVLGVTVETLVTRKETAPPQIADPQITKRKIMDVISKLDRYNAEVIASMAHALLNLQSKMNHWDK